MRFPFIALLLSACATTSPQQLVDQYVDGTFAEAPELARAAGLHDGFDGKVSAVGAEADAQRLSRAKAHVAAVDALDLATISDPLRLDLELTRLHARRTIFAIEKLALTRNILGYAGLFDGSSYLNRDYAPLPQRVGFLLDHLQAAADQTDAVIVLLKPKHVRTHLQTAQKMLGGMLEYFEGDMKTLAQPALSDPALLARWEKVVPEAQNAVKKLLAWVDAALPQATEDFALGEATFLEMLAANEGLVITLPELKQLAVSNHASNYEAYVATAKRIDATKTVQEVAAMVQAERIAKDQVIPVARQQLDDLLAFIEAQKIITIGSDDRAEVRETPPFMRWNSAFLDMAGPFERAKGSFYYLSPPDPSWPQDMQDAYLPYAGDLLATSIHEVYPGHFVHGLHLRRAKTRVQQLFDSYAFTEGWAHYTEEMMLEAGFAAGDDRAKLGQLTNALLRNCRFLAAIGMHVEGMTVEQAKQLFEEKCFIDPGNALQQAYRGTFDPGYLSYTLGKLQILELRKKYWAKHNTQSWQAFHDWLLSFGAAPVALVEQRL